jgi:hypothetical protein
MTNDTITKAADNIRILSAAMVEKAYELKVGAFRYFKDIEKDNLDPDSLL